MNCKFGWPAATLAALSMTSLATYAAEADKWNVEITPYIWAVGVQADVTAGDREAEVDASFSDILDYLDMSASFIANARYNSWVVRAQVDYLELSSDLESPFEDGELETEVTMSTLGFGYEFQGWMDNQTIDVLLGVRNLTLDNELDLGAQGSFEGDSDVTDGIIMVQPNFQLSKKWRFNPIFSYGEGDSEYTYELQPQFQYQAWEHVAFRFGYRKIHYKIESDNDDRDGSFDGDFVGPFLGISATFGADPAPEPEPVAAPTPAPAPVVAAAPKKDGDGDGVIDDNDQCPNSPKGQQVDAIGCGYDIHVEAQFDNDSASIKPESFAALDRAVALLKSVPSMRGVIEGYTDSTGSDQYNQALSERRAAAVSKYLVDHGIDKSRVPSMGMGEANPVGDNATPEGRAQNRRVVLKRSDR